MLAADRLDYWPPWTLCAQAAQAGTRLDPAQLERLAVIGSQHPTLLELRKGNNQLREALVHSRENEERLGAELQVIVSSACMSPESGPPGNCKVEADGGRKHDMCLDTELPAPACTSQTLFSVLFSQVSCIICPMAAELRTVLHPNLQLTLNQA